MKRTITALATALLLALLSVAAFADTIPGTAQLTITPTDTQVSGDTATITYAVTVTPPEGKELGVFSVRLQPSDGMTLTQDTSKMTFGDGNLTYNAATGKGIFATYGYTPQTGYFAAVGTTPERRMSQEATILTIQATIPADQAGTYTLGAEFIAALDGSGDVYTARVATTPVTIADGKAPVTEKEPVITDGSGNGQSATIADGSTGGADTSTDGSSTPGSFGSGSATVPDADSNGAVSGDTAADGEVAQQTASGGSAALWVIGAVVIVAAVVTVVMVRRRKH